MKSILSYSSALFLGLSLVMSACGNSEHPKDDDELVVDSSAFNNGGIEFLDMPATAGFPDAKLEINEPITMPWGNDSVKVDFTFLVSNYQLGAQTADAAARGCANSKDGQHIHFILDNGPYAALYEPKHSVSLAKNSEHTLLCFLSRSYHESIKSPQAAQLVHFKIDEKGSFIKLETPTEPMVFYSRPKGDYVGADTANVLLDFYLWNVSLGPNYKIKANITNTTTGKSMVGVIDSWKAMKIVGLGTGACQVELTLMDKNIQPVSGSFTNVSRKFNLSAAEPLP